VKEICVDLLVSLCNAKDYVRAVLLQDDGIVAIGEYDPRIAKIAAAWQQRLDSIVSGLPIHWVGSTALGIPGLPDVDLVVECDASRIAEFVEPLSRLLDRPIGRTRRYARWSRQEGDVTVDVLLADPETRLYRRVTESYRLMLAKPELLEEYKDIKRQSQGLSRRWYEYRRNRFFNKLFFKHGSGASLLRVTADAASQPHRI
jgi:GrpB-like predicted nucleotidyltransferase (UPF0157 family)